MEVFCSSEAEVGYATAALTFAQGQLGNEILTIELLQPVVELPDFVIWW